MKRIFYVCQILLLASWVASGQVAFVYDQQSSTDETPVRTGGAIQQHMPLGQSFTPNFGKVGFIGLKLFDGYLNNDLGATLHVKLRANSISGSILGSTTPVTLPDGFGGTVNFLFPSNVSVTAGMVYFFEVVVESGDLWGISAGEFYYPGGTTISDGQPIYGGDLWFREGIIVPIISIERTNDKPLLRFATFSNQNYSVEYSPDLSSGSWSNLLGTNIQGSGQDATVLDTNVTMSINRFYRLKLVP